MTQMKIYMQIKQFEENKENGQRYIFVFSFLNFLYESNNNLYKTRPMKSRVHLISLVMVLSWVQEVLSAYCVAPFQDVPYSTGYYCAKCDTTCLTCLGSSINQCSTCPTDFTLNSNSSTCAAPINASVDTVANQYHTFNFISEWTSTTAYFCGTVTLVTPSTTGGTVSTTHTLPPHYQIRVRVAFWSWTGNQERMVFTYSDLNSAYSNASNSNFTVYSNFVNQAYNASCTDAYATNFEKYINDSTVNPSGVRVTFGSNINSWGVNQYIFLVYKCYQPDCASCSGANQNQCFSCSDSIKTLYNTPGQCQCNFSLGYYAYPTGNSTYYCVNPCPNLPSGQYYGDNQTKTCVLSCPVDSTNTAYWNLSFASDTDNLCVKRCWASITLGGTVFPLYYDLVGRKCTTKCPSGQPYSNPVDLACYTNCPSNSGTQYYNLDLNYTCVATCPAITNSSNGLQIPLFKLKLSAVTATGAPYFIYTCVQVCPSGKWGYTDSNGVRECVDTTCPSPQFTDNSTGRPICREICAAPDWFGNIQLNPPVCVQTCSAGYYGDQNDPNGKRQCVSKCNGSYYGLPSGGKCVIACPDGSWGEELDRICVSAPFWCSVKVSFSYTSTVLTGTYLFYPDDAKGFADNFTHKCVWANQTCSNNMYKLNSSFTCQLTCPSSTYGHPLTFWCVDKCYGIYFADPQLNKCVEVCSPGLYADIGSGNTCVSNCNQTGGYPYRDADLRQCVKVCSNGYADPIAQSCVFNCTPGLYLNGSDQYNQSYRVCAFNCTSPYFAYNNTDSGICLQTCPANPILFGDTVSGLRICVQVCRANTYGDQTNNSYRHCVSNCPNNTFAQSDSLRRCVTRCNSSTYGRSTDWTCVEPLNCPTNFTGDPTTNLCVNWCPPANETFADNISKLCVSKCPNNTGTVYYADWHIRWCIPTCQNYNATYSQFGNNSTQTCETSCLDNNSYADAQSPRRYCIALCTNTVTDLYYRNNFTMTCVVSTGCNSAYFGDNSTAYCVNRCPKVPSASNASILVQTWGYRPTKTCVALCLPGTFGDDSSGIPLCVSLCAQFPLPKWSYLGPNDNMSVMLCMAVCPTPYFGQDFLRTCLTACPRQNSSHNQTYSYDVTRRCLLNCPNTTYADYIDGICYHFSVNCTIYCPYTWTNCSNISYRWGDPYNNSCTYLCTASPWDTYGDNTTQTCTTRCAVGSYADNYTGTRTCIAICPGYYTAQGVVNTTFKDIRNVSFDSYGDNFTQRCVQHCITPSTFADWQTHVCAYRCTGDNSSWVPTYANIFNQRCVISLFCPTTPDLYFGDNITRSCLPSCPYNVSSFSFADNITRACIPICYKFYNASNNVTTMFYGDTSTNRPACVIACATLPRLFGRNDTNRCVAECPNYQYGDQTGNRSCVPVCPLINGVTWFSQLTERICVVVCQDATWGNYYNSSGPHCETVGTDCKPGQFADNSTHLCVDLCPQSMNYFGDPSTRLCTTYCPLLNSSVFNATANINLTAGRLFADYKTRLCVYTCPADFGLQGTFGDNSTNTCVQRCPAGSFGDSHTVNRFCVEVCTGGSYADPSTMLCVDVCPASPPFYGYAGNWTCLKKCPGELWADDATRTCVSSCAPRYRQSTTGQCVAVCPSQLDLYGDSNGYNCTPVCTLGQYADPTDRTCKSNCSPLFQYNYRCVKYCPKGYFANSTKNCVPPLQCNNNTFGDNSTTQCVTPCPAWSFADSASGYCIAICPTGKYGQLFICQPNCTISGTSYSNITQQCMSTCPNATYSLLGACVPNCTGTTYQRQDTRICDTSCASGLWADPTTHRCVKTCPYNWYRQSTGAYTGFCVPMNSGCSPLFADFYTGNCVTRCSSGFWGFGNSSNSSSNFAGNYTCIKECPSGLYGFQNGTERNCYPPNGLPTTITYFADTLSAQFVAECPQIPILYYGDANRQLCVPACESFNLTANVITLYYGDPQARQCKSSCTNATYSADNATKLCTLKCSLGTFRFNDTPVCVTPCFVGYGDYTTRTCVAVCPSNAATFGFYNTTTGSRLCVTLCPLTFYAEPFNRTCVSLCPNTPGIYFAYNTTRECLLQCKQSFADQSNQRCVSQCLSSAYPNADNSTNKCVYTCPSLPDYYADNHVCVFYCVTPNTFADPANRTCLARCSNTSIYTQYGDPRTGRCERNCSEGTWGYNGTNTCVQKCEPGTFADNTTGKCVAECPKIENIYADMILRVCAYTCSNGTFGSQINQTCIARCDDGYWGDPTTTLCTPLCPVKIYSFGENVTRRCVPSCKDYTGYADNHSRLCRQYCQHTIPVQTFIDYTTYSCVEICPQGSWAVNHNALNSTINQCTQKCPSGFADNFSQWCVAVCPDDPESYGDTHNKVCTYTCIAGQFSDNTTNLCVPICPNLTANIPVDYYGDPLAGRCVLWCTEGTYAQNDTSRLCVNPCPPGEFADNLTRRCVANCPVSQATFADSVTHRCVRICPPGYWAENTTQTCVADCWTYTTGPLTGVVGYQDNLTNFCVSQCPFGYFGTNFTHACVTKCPISQKEYGHFIGRVCVGTDNTTNVTDCYGNNATGHKYYADPTTQTCVQKCPLGLWADTHLQRCVPICQVALHQFRNNHTQMCVWPCPSNPDQFADSVSGDCVRTCPSGYWANIDNRTCVQYCGEFGKFADNTTNRCEYSCASLPYLFADYLTHTCEPKCSGGQFADNRTQTCVVVCPAQWAYFGQTQNYTCVSLCPDGWFADANDARRCRTTCINNYFSDNYTSTCVEHCRFVRPFWYEDTSKGHGVCVAVCPGESYAFNPDQTCKYQDNVTFASTCPWPYFADRASRQCVKFCPAGSFANNHTQYCQFTCSGSEYADPVIRACVTTCSPNLFKHVQNGTVPTNTSNNKCVQYCPSPLFAQNATGGTDARCVQTCSNLGLPSTRTCQNYCPHPYFANPGIFLCVLQCNPMLKYVPTRTCLSTCLSPYYGNPVNFTCDLLCPVNYFGRNDSRRCDTGCYNGSFSDPSIRICVSNCPGSPLLYADGRTFQCLSFCTSPLFGYERDLTCRTSCPNVTVNGKNLVYLADASNRLCVLQCVNAEISFADYNRNECTQFCPNGTFANNYTKQCVRTCPKVPNDTFSDNSSHICMDVCLPGSFGMASKLNCVAACWWPFFADPTTRRCVDVCPKGYFSDNASATCRTTCPPNSFADPVTRRCLAMCPALQLYFNYNGNWTCLLTCPPRFFANTDTRYCESICNSSSGMFAYLPTGQCVRECPVPTRGFAPNFTCVNQCPPLYYFYDVTINVCALCDPTCVICASTTTCLQCQSGYNLFSGFCTRSCLPSNGVVTYADPDGTCVKVCPNTFFGENTTYSCTQNCPTSQFGDPATKLCTYCPPNCASCDSWSFCTTCAVAATLAIDNMCYKDCSITAKYSYNRTCYNSCPAGSYLTYTGVTCAACGPLCLTCFGSATACTSCATTYFYNNTCLTTCPTGFYGSTSLQCLSCSGSRASACTNPLNFSTSFSTQNFQPVITLQFNQNVSMSKDISEILKINLNLGRLLEQEEGELRGRQLSLGTIVNNGITYTYQILSNGTIRLYPQIGSSLITPTFSVQISDPAAVTSQSGVTLQNVQSTLSVPALEYYPPESGTKAGTNFPAKLLTIFVLVLYGVTFIFSDVMVRPLQWLQVFFFHCCIAVGVPANIYYHLIQMKNSTLQFLDNWFTGGLPKSSPYYNSPQKVIDVFTDEIFLRHVGPMFLLLVILGGFWFVFMILGSKYVIRHKVWLGFFQELSKKRYQLMVLNDVFSVFFFPIVYFAFMQIPNLTVGSGFYTLNAGLTVVLLACALVMPIAWTLMWKARSREQTQERLWFLTLRVKPLAGEKPPAIHDKQSADQLKEKSHHSEQLYQHKEQPLKKEDRNPRQLQSVIFLSYQFLMALWMTTLYNSPNMQLILLVGTNALLLGYHLKVRPQLNILNLIFTVLAILFMVAFEAVYLFFLNNTQLTATQKTARGHALLIASDVFCVIFCLWALWRVVWECSFYWQNFKRTQLYLEFADHDYVAEAEKVTEYSLYEPKVENNEVGLGDIVIDEIRDKVGPTGEKIIAVRKKMLRKKAKPMGRKKKDGAELLDQQSVRQDYVRINQMNVFDYQQDNFEDQPQPQQQTRRRAIDDDIRDILSDDDKISRYRQQQEEEKKIDIDPEEQILAHLDSISAVHGLISSDKVSQFPFAEIQQEEEREQEEKMGEEGEQEGEQEVEVDHFYKIDKQQSPKISPRAIQREDEISEPQEGESEQPQNAVGNDLEQLSNNPVEVARYEELQSELSRVQQPQNPNNPTLIPSIDPHEQSQSQPNNPSKIQPYQQQPQQQPQAMSQQQKQKEEEMQSINIDDLPNESEIMQRPKIKNIEDLLEQEQSGKKKNLLFLFDDFDEEDN